MASFSFLFFTIPAPTGVFLTTGTGIITGITTR